MSKLKQYTKFETDCIRVRTNLSTYKSYPNSYTIRKYFELYRIIEDSYSIKGNKTINRIFYYK